MEPRPAHQNSTQGLAAILVVLGSTFLGCGRIRQPLNDQGRSSVQEPQVPTPALVRVVACWPAFPLAEDLVDAYAPDHPSVSIDLIPAASPVARSMVSSGRADVAIVAQPIDSSGASRLSPDASSLLASESLAVDAVGIIVHRGSSLRELSMAEVAGLFAGYRLDWEELGAGHGRPEILTQEEGSAMRSIFDEAVMGQQTISSAAVVLPHDRGVLEYVAENPLAIGYLSTAYVDERVRLVAIGGSEPTPKEIQRGGYPLVYSLEIMLSPGASPEASRLASFALSNKGREIVARRYVPPS